MLTRSKNAASAPAGLLLTLTLLAPPVPPHEDAGLLGFEEVSSLWWKSLGANIWARKVKCSFSYQHVAKKNYWGDESRSMLCPCDPLQY